MKQFGNLAIICARRQSVQLVVESGEVRVTLRKFPGQLSCHLRWDDDQGIQKLIYELNFGKYRETN